MFRKMNKEIFRKRFINLLKNYLVFHNRKAIGYSEEEIKKIEKLYDIEVKGDFREFLRIAGRSSDGLLTSTLTFYYSHTTVGDKIREQNYGRKKLKNLKFNNFDKSKIFLLAVEPDSQYYYIDTVNLNVYLYDDNLDDEIIEDTGQDFDSYMLSSIYYFNPKMVPLSIIYSGELLPKNIINEDKNVTSYKIDNYLSDDKKNNNSFIYLLEKYLEKNNRQAMGYNDEEIEEIEKFYEITIKDDLKDFFRMAGRSDGGLLGKIGLLFYKNWEVRKRCIFQDDFNGECLVKNKYYTEANCYPFIFFVEDSLYYFVTTRENSEFLESYTKKDRVHCYNMETQELTHTGKTFNEFMVDLVHKTNPDLEVGEEKIGEMIDIKIDDEVSEELEDMKIIGYQEEKVPEREEAEKFVLTEDIKPELTQEQIAKKEANKKFDETRNWLGSRTERTLYKGSIFPVSRFVERIKDFDTGETYELEEALKKFREIMGLPKEEK